MIFNVIKILTPAIVCFIIGIALTPWLTSYMYSKRMWKNSSRSKENTEAMSKAFVDIHNEAGEKSTPRVGGILIWLSVLITILVIAILSFIYPTDATTKLNFL